MYNVHHVISLSNGTNGRKLLRSLILTALKCCGACVLFGIPRLVLGENTTFLGAETFLKDRAVEVINLDLEEPKQMMQVFIDKHPDIVSSRLQ